MSIPEVNVSAGSVPIAAAVVAPIVPAPVVKPEMGEIVIKKDGTSIPPIINNLLQSPQLQCRWDDCQAAFNEPKQLTSHIQTHIIDGTIICHWKDCGLQTKNTAALATHIRKHSSYQPYFCTLVDCNSNFSTSIDLLAHFKDIHNVSPIFQSSWFSYINELDNYKYLPGDLNSESLVKKYESFKSNKQFIDSLDTSQKVDFIKIQNVSLEDIVSEPVRKKGRTANSEINIGLRNTFKEQNGKYKQTLGTASQKSFDDLEASHMQPLEPDSIIQNASKDELVSIHESLNRKFLWGLEVNQLFKKDLEALKAEEKLLWKKKESLLDASIISEIPSANLHLYRADE